MTHTPAPRTISNAASAPHASDKCAMWFLFIWARKERRKKGTNKLMMRIFSPRSLTHHLCSCSPLFFHSMHIIKCSLLMFSVCCRLSNYSYVQKIVSSVLFIFFLNNHHRNMCSKDEKVERVEPNQGLRVNE